MSTIFLVKRWRCSVPSCQHAFEFDPRGIWHHDLPGDPGKVSPEVREGGSFSGKLPKLRIQTVNGYPRVQVYSRQNLSDGSAHSPFPNMTLFLHPCCNQTPLGPPSPWDPPPLAYSSQTAVKTRSAAPLLPCALDAVRGRIPPYTHARSDSVRVAFKSVSHNCIAHLTSRA